MPTIAVIVVVVVIAVVAGAAGYFIGYNNRKKTAEAQIGSAEAEATRLVNEAIKTAECASTKKKLWKESSSDWRLRKYIFLVPAWIAAHVRRKS